MYFNTDFGLRYEYYNGIDFELDTCRYTLFECVTTGITLKHNRKKLVIDGTGSTVTGSFFLNNEVECLRLLCKALGTGWLEHRQV